MKKAKSSARGFVVGKSYLIRTVTNYWTGKLVRLGPKELTLETAAWIADTGRFSQALGSGQFNEIEPVKGSAIVGRGSIVDAVEWPHVLPVDVK